MYFFLILTSLTLITYFCLCSWKRHHFLPFLWLNRITSSLSVRLSRNILWPPWLDIVNPHLADVPFASLAFSSDTRHEVLQDFYVGLFLSREGSSILSLQWPSPFPCHRHHYRIPFRTHILWRFFMAAFHSAAKSRFLEGVTSMSVIIHKVYNFSWTLLKKQYELNYFRNFLDC